MCLVTARQLIYNKIQNYSLLYSFKNFVAPADFHSPHKIDANGSAFRLTVRASVFASSFFQRSVGPVSPKEQIIHHGVSSYPNVSSPVKKVDYKNDDKTQASWDLVNLLYCSNCRFGLVCGDKHGVFPSRSRSQAIAAPQSSFKTRCTRKASSSPNSQNSE